MIEDDEFFDEVEENEWDGCPVCGALDGHFTTCQYYDEIEEP